MKNKRILLIVSTLAALVSCSKVEEKAVGELSSTDFRLEYTDIDIATEISDGIPTKQIVSGVKFETNWEASDAVAVYNATRDELNRYVVKSGAGTKYAVFTPDGVAPSYGASDELYIIYPYDAASLEGGQLYLSIYRDEKEDSYSLSANKVFSRNDLLMSERLTPASLNGDDLKTRDITLYRLVALLNLTAGVSDSDLSYETVEKVLLKCKGVAGKSAVEFTDGVPSLTPNAGSEDKCIFLTADAPKMASKDYLGRFIPIFPVNMSQDPNNGFSFILLGDAHEAGFHRALDYTMEGNASVNFFLVNGLFGLYPLYNEADAYTDFSWWYGDLPDEFMIPKKLARGELYYGAANCVVMPAGQLTAVLDVSLFEAGDNHARTHSPSTQYDYPAAYARVLWCEPGLELREPYLYTLEKHLMLHLEAYYNDGGNALVGIYDEKDNLLWSFHLWAPVNYDYYYVNGYVTLQYTLGQVNGDTDTYMYYQWGRKDPLGRAAGYEQYGTELFSTNGPKPLLLDGEGVMDGPVSLDEARKNPTVFINPKNLTLDWSSTPDANLWKDSYKTIYDPCPEGYRIANSNIWMDMTHANSIVTTSPFVFRNYNGLIYPACGWRSADGLSMVGEDGGYYAAGEHEESDAPYLFFTPHSLSFSNAGVTSNAFAVRCAQD
jgi:hypothetical protein